MDGQVVYDLFTSMLQKRGVKDIDLNKELPGLLAYGCEKGCFQNPHSVHELSEWRKFGDILWEGMLDEDKAAKKMGKLWRVIHNEMLQIVAEKKAAERAGEADKRNIDCGREGEPAAPATRRVVLPLLTTGVAREEDGAWQSHLEESLGGQAQRQGPPPSAAQPQSTPPGEPDGNRPSQGPKMSLQPLRVPEPIPGALSDLWGEMVKQRREVWSNLAREALREGDEDMLQAAGDMTSSSGALTFPVVYQTVEVDVHGVDAQGNPQVQRQQQQVGQYPPLDWKLLSQLRQTVTQFGVQSEPVKQMLNYIFDSQLLLPVDLRGISKLIFTQHQQISFNAHWQELVNASVATQRGPGNPLHGITMEELLGVGLYMRTEAQMMMGPDKIREAMRLVRQAINKVKEPGGQPMFMRIKQGREETFGSFIDRVAAAIDRAGVAECMKEALLKQCAIQNSTPEIQHMIATMGGDWGIAEALERAATMPSGPQAFLVRALEKLGEEIQKQVEAMQAQVLAALAALQASVAAGQGAQMNSSARCYRCGGGGHFRKNCGAKGVWCQTCQSCTHNTRACRRQTAGNSRRSSGSHARTQITTGKATPP
ncbi:GA113 protein, partial [Erpornis zantholeuca]|nr:GA113 protein [Erpornis zantholeuca]